jgi:hypothetical protein
MRTLIYTTGIMGGLLLVFWLIGTLTKFPWNDWLMISGLILLGLICLPLSFIDRYRYNKKIDEIIKSYKAKDRKITTIKIKGQDSKSTPKGWDMNTSPFRERKSGLTWGGGNIKGANATRGNRRSFLK